MAAPFSIITGVPAGMSTPPIDVERCARRKSRCRGRWRNTCQKKRSAHEVLMPKLILDEPVKPNGREPRLAINEVWSINAPESQASIMMSQIGIGAKVQLQEFYERQVRQFLAERYQRSSVLANRMQAEAAFDRLRSLPGLVEVKEQVSQLASLCEERRQLAEQERLHHWLHAWLLFHIPLSVALLVLAVAHVVAALYY